MEMQPAHPGSAQDRIARFPWPLAFLYVAVPTLIGLGLAVVLHLRVVLPAIGAGATDVTRGAVIGQFLDTPFEKPTAVFVGDSVTVEGIDTAFVRESWDPLKDVYNLAMNGGNPTDLTVMLPKVVAAKPRWVIFTLRPRSIGEPIPLDADKTSAYAWGRFAQAWPPDWAGRDFPGFGPKGYDWATQSERDAQLHFRTTISTWINRQARARLRSGYVPMRPDNFQNPAELRLTLGPEGMDRNLNALVAENDAALANGTEIGQRVVEQLVAHVHRAGATPVVVISPLHPRLRDVPSIAGGLRDLRDFAQRLSVYHQALIIDAVEAIPEDGFADGQHPNARGREILSRWVGERLPQP